jgi:hypothetical protein
MPRPAGTPAPEELMKDLRDRVPFLVTHAQEKDVLRILRTFRRQYREYLKRKPVESRLKAISSGWEWLLPKKRGRPPSRSKSTPASVSKPRGRPKGRHDTASYSPLSIGIALALESGLFSKGELVRLLIKDRVIPEGGDKSDANPYHRLDRIAKVGNETLKLYPNLRQDLPKSKTRLIVLLRRCTPEYLRP